ncbi:phage tail assembly chaperone [Peteryoungia desertarenae]|uniref:Phage tail assembly chaperone n=2 Tax=Peteryoungia desertarenae TaxID=1813451 RepID=A0ABX6QMW8_9HYPH|nr:phage tail assembly chaperone [Peteryoungia desertarenae]
MAGRPEGVLSHDRCRTGRRAGWTRFPLKAAGEPEPETSAAPFPWDAVMAIGLGRLRLATRDFWALSPREFAALAGFLEKRGGAMARADLAKLMRRFPDEPPA